MTSLELEAILPGSSNTLSQYDIEVLRPELEQLAINDWYVEIGVFKGRSLCLAALTTAARIYGVDIVNNVSQEGFEAFDSNNVYYDWRGSNGAARDWEDPIAMLFIDGDHSYEGVKADWNNWSKFIQPGGKVFFHDCDETSPGVVQVFEEIKANRDFTDFTIYKRSGLNTSLASCRRKS